MHLPRRLLRPCTQAKLLEDTSAPGKDDADYIDPEPYADPKGGPSMFKVSGERAIRKWTVIITSQGHQRLILNRYKMLPQAKECSSAPKLELSA